MELVEIRELEGPNLFLLRPAIKIEVAIPVESTVALLNARTVFEPTEESPPEIQELADLIASLLQSAGEINQEVSVVPMETPGHFAIVFGWENRPLARAIAGVIKSSIEGERIDLVQATSALRELSAATLSDGDRPALIKDANRNVVTVAVTGTNGKTTTTRLISHIFQTAGRSVGWSCSSGVYINGVEVLSGDYSGPKGAERAVTDPSVEIAVTETARGGILLRGVVYESVDVSVFTNISADHLDLQGVRTVEGLAKAKSVVAKITRENGYAILNAADPLVMSSTRNVKAKRFLVAEDRYCPELTEHAVAGGLAMTVVDGTMTLIETGVPTPVLALRDIPMTFGGKATFMVENCLLGAAAALAAGATLSEVRDGLQTFENSPDLNPGRMNIFDINGVTVILDFAHNEVGLEVLLDFTASAKSPNGKVFSVIGTAGDRNDASLTEIGRIAATKSDHVIAKGTTKYLRGRELDELLNLYVAGIKSGPQVPFETSPNELTGTKRALELAQPGDVVAVMAQEYVRELSECLNKLR